VEGALGMPKTDKGEPPKAKVLTRASAPAKSTDPEERLDELRRKLERLNREAEMLGEAMRQKPKK
jgi:hypothetical protein